MPVMYFVFSTIAVCILVGSWDVERSCVMHSSSYCLPPMRSTTFYLASLFSTNVDHAHVWAGCAVDR